MKLAFSTIGCPECTLEEILALATRDGFAGVEFSGLRRETDLARVTDFLPVHISETRRRLRDAGVAVAGLACPIRLLHTVGSEIDLRVAAAHIEYYIQLARELLAGYVRLVPGDPPAEMTRMAAHDRLVPLLRRLGDMAQAAHVTLVLETIGAYARSETTENFLRHINHPGVQALWDVNRTYRQAGEPIHHTLQFIGKYIQAVHVTDSQLDAQGERAWPVLLGQGDVPVQRAVHALQEMGYDGYLTYVWPRRVYPQLPNADEAFPLFVTRLNTWLTAA